MPPKGKSSASAGTRKKHAKKAAGKDGEQDTAPKQQPKKLQRGQKKLSKAQQRALPKIKQYIPPPKPPAPPILDPLDGQGLANILPAELVVILRRLGKKDDVTRRKGLDDFRDWVLDVRKEADEVEREVREAVLVSAVPVWMHNLSSLLQSPFHRSATLQVHADLLAIPSVRGPILDTLSHSILPGTQNRDVLGSWLVAALEEGRRNGGVGLASWEASTAWESGDRIDLTDLIDTLVEFLSLSILHPPSLHDDIHPAPVSSAPSVPPPNKGKQKAQTPVPEVDSQDTDERWARYRVGGLTGLDWLIRQNRPSADLMKLVHDPALWSCLSPSASDEPKFGVGQPPVRRAAYVVLRALMDTHPEELAKEDFLETLVSEMLEVIWLDSDAIVWETAGPVVARILNKHRDLWNRSIDEQDEQDEEEDGEDQDGTPTCVAFDRFLDFISTICPSIPQHTYPLLIIILSTLPDRLLALNDPSIRLETLFAHLWSPVDAKLLSTHSLPGQPSVFQMFIRDMVDCTCYLISRAWKEEEIETANWLMAQLSDRVWKEAVLQLGAKAGGRGGVKPEYEATILGQALARIPPSLAEDLLTTVEDTLLASCEASDDLLSRALRIISALRSAANDPTQTRLDQLTANLAHTCAERLDTDRGPNFSATFVEAIANASIPTKEKAIRKIGSSEIYQALPPQQLASLLKALADAGYRSQISKIISEQLASASQDLRFDIARHVASTGLLETDAIDVVTEEAVQAALVDARHTSVAATCVTADISPGVLQTVLALVCTEIHDAAYDILTSNPARPIPTAAIDILAAYGLRHLEEITNSDIFSPALISLHHIVVLLPRLQDPPFLPESAISLWAAASSSMAQSVVRDLAHLLQDTSCRVEPSILVDVALLQIPASELPSILLPPTEQLERLVSEYTARPAHPSLALVDPLISCSDTEDESTFASNFDSHGRSKAARLAEAALGLIRSNRHLASNANLMATLLAARALAKDAIAVPGASRGFLESAIPSKVLEQLVQEAEGALSFLLTDYDEATLAWHEAAISVMRSGQGDPLQTLLASLARVVGGPGDDVAARTLRDVLVRHLRQCGAGEKEGALWLACAIQKAESNPMLAMAIVLAVKPIMLDSSALATAQNRLASSLAGIPPRQANDKGIAALRLLVASAPPSDAPSVFLPQQRAMFVLRHLASWLTSDEADDFVDDLEYRIAELYTVLAPVVQDLPGAHWDSIFDLIETGLDSASLEDPASLCLTYQFLALLQQVCDLCETNKSLRAVWTSKATHMSLVFRLFLQCKDATTLPKRMIQSLLLDLLRDATDVGDDEAGLVGLLSSRSMAVQTTAYRLLNQTIKRQTLALVLEVESSVEEQKREIKLPQELLTIPGEAAATVDWHGDIAVPTVLGQLLAWMAILDHFDDASRTIRWAYLDHLNDSALLSGALLPMLFAILGVSETGAWNFGASAFAVDEFYPDLLDPEELADLTPLASHVYYRTLVNLPSAIRAYYESLKDRQLSMSMLNFTARNYSPVIIQNEFAALREPSAMAQLTEEGLNIKIASGGGATVAGGGSAEAIASYVVDEQPMEIGIRLPSEFPLKAVDVRDLRRVGVPENKWRGWLMSVQQTITSRNGLILDALTVFKKNVSLHFEGVVECAICYSIISLTDRTLPTKPCRTCKNRFHASCLYKWFNSSHSSSCPLCRALF